MVSLIRRLFDLRSGEAGLVARSAVTLFGLIAAHTMLETARDALFLGKLPVSRLTLVYGLMAILSFFVARANAQFVGAFGRRNGLIITLLGAAFGTVVLYRLEPTRAVVFALYIWSGLLGSIIVVQFWMLVGHAYTVAQGKRLFGLLASGGVLGAVAGASASVAVVNYIDVHQLLLVAATIYLATALFITGEHVDEVVQNESDTEEDRLFTDAVGLFTDYPYLLRISLLVGVSTAAVLSMDYLFKAVAASTMPADELGLFFARYYAVLNSVALVVQLFVSSALVGRLGVIGAYLVLPCLLLLGGGVSLLVGGTAAVLAAKGADGALRHSLHRISSELLWMPLPDRVRAQAKGVVDTFMVRGTQALMAGVLLLLAMLGIQQPEELAVLVVVLSAAWLFLGLGLRRSYLDLFRSALSGRESNRLELDLRSVEVVIESLSSRNPQSAIAAIELLDASRRARLIPALVLYHESPQVLLRALQVVPQADRKDWVPLAERLLSHELESVRVAALEALAQNGYVDLVQGRLLDVSPWVRAHAAFWLAHHLPTKTPSEEDSVRLILDMPGIWGRQARLGLLEAVEASGDERWANLLLALTDEGEAEVAQAAVGAMTQIRDPRFIPLLIRRLAVRDGRSTVRQAIVALGPSAFDALVVAMKDGATDKRVLVHIPGTLARFADRRAASILTDALDTVRDGRIRYKVLKALVHVAAKTKTPIDAAVSERRCLLELQEHFRMASLHWCLAADVAERDGIARQSGELLVGLLQDKRDQALDRVFLFLQASLPEEDLRAVRTAATATSDRRRRAQAQEFLDALTLGARSSDLRPLLRLAVDDLPMRDRITRARTILTPPGRPDSTVIALNLGEALQVLIRDPDEAVAGLAAYHVLESGRTEYSQDVIEATGDRPLTESIRNLLNSIGAMGGTPGVA